MTDNNRLDDERNKRMVWQANEDRLREIARREAEEASRNIREIKIREIIKEETDDIVKDSINDYSRKYMGIDTKSSTQPYDPARLFAYMVEEIQRDVARRKWWGTTAMAVMGAVGMSLLSLILPIILRRLGLV